MMTDTMAETLAIELRGLIHQRIPFPPRTPEDRRAANIRRYRMDEIKKELANEFGNRNGWKWSQSDFSPSQLGRRSTQPKRNECYSDWQGNSIGPLADHLYFYRQPTKPYRPAALAVHLYDFSDTDTWRLALEQFCSRHRLRFDKPDFPSWWYPGWTTLLVYTPAGLDANQK